MILYYHHLLKVNLLGLIASQLALRVSRQGLEVRANRLTNPGQNQNRNLVGHQEDPMVHPLTRVHLVHNQEDPNVHLVIRVHRVHPEEPKVHPVMQVHHAHQEDREVHLPMKALHVQKANLVRVAVNTLRHPMTIYKSNV